MNFFSSSKTPTVFKNKDRVILPVICRMCNYKERLSSCILFLCSSQRCRNKLSIKHSRSWSLPVDHLVFGILTDLEEGPKYWETFKHLPCALSRVTQEGCFAMYSLCIYDTILLCVQTKVNNLYAWSMRRWVWEFFHFSNLTLRWYLGSESDVGKGEEGMMIEKAKKCTK